MDTTPQARRARRVLLGRGVAAAAVVATVVGTLAAGATPAVAAKTPTPQAPARLRTPQPNGRAKAKGATKSKPGRAAQQLRQGDALQTDTAGMAQIDYSDGSLTRLSPSTTFTITK